MYFRIIVKNAGFFMFRTSKISTVAALNQALNMIEAGRDAANEAGQEMTTEVLQVEGAPVGKILSNVQLTALLAEDDSAGEPKAPTAAEVAKMDVKPDGSTIDHPAPGLTD